MATITMKTCAGVPKWGIPSHDAHVGAFGTDHSHADGLTRVCKADWKTYLQLRAAAVAAGTAPARQARTPKVAQGDATAPEPAPVVVDGTAAQEAEQAALERRHPGCRRPRHSRRPGAHGGCSCRRGRRPPRLPKRGPAPLPRSEARPGPGVTDQADPRPRCVGVGVTITLDQTDAVLAAKALR